MGDREPVCVCVCVCVVCAHACVCACLCVCVCARMRARPPMCGPVRSESQEAYGLISGVTHHPLCHKASH